MYNSIHNCVYSEYYFVTYTSYVYTNIKQGYTCNTQCTSEYMIYIYTGQLPSMCFIVKE